MSGSDDGLLCPCLCGAEPPVPRRMLEPMDPVLFRAPRGTVFLDGADGVARAQMERQDRMDEMNHRIQLRRDRDLRRAAAAAGGDALVEAEADDEDDDPNDDDGDDR